MKTVTFIALVLAVLGAQAPAIAALQESDTVPSNQLITDLSVIRTGSESDVAVVPFFFKAPEKEGDGPSLLKISADETITFSVGTASVVCHHDETCRLPFVTDGAYSVEIKRFNGELLHSAIKLPQDTRLTSPKENSFFLKSEPIEFSWTPSAAPTRGIALSVFLAGLNCDTTGSLSWEKDFSAVVPAGYVGSCAGPVKARFTMFYVNTARVVGAAGGVLKGYAQDLLHFTFMESDGTSPALRAEAAPAQTDAELRAFLLQARDFKGGVLELRQ